MNQPLDPQRGAVAKGPAALLSAALAVTLVLSILEWTATGFGRTKVTSSVAVLVYLLAALGAWAGAAGFEPGDHLRRAWGLLSLANVALAAGRLLFPEQLLGLPDTSMVAWLRALATLLSNVLGVWGTALFALTWWRTGLPLPGSRRGKIAVGVLLTVLALAVPAPHLVESIRGALGGDPYAGAMAVGDASDAAVFLLIAPVFLTARALWGGSLSWPFGFLAASCACWLLLDASEFLGDIPGAPPWLAPAITAFLRTLACLLLAIAGLSHRMAIRSSASPVVRQA
ncbi:MAG TPA: hypothetical protein VFG59_13065 [Anaeromyxobacter sp.]|nr:hypothetical protein [Anaeromyxobacter sp.]